MAGGVRCERKTEKDTGAGGQKARFKAGRQASKGLQTAQERVLCEWARGFAKVSTICRKRCSGSKPKTKAKKG